MEAMQTNTQHTPGPWKDKGLPDLRGIHSSKGEQIAVATFLDLEGRWEEAVANARLIAACPAMYNYLASKCASGDNEASLILEAIHGSTKGN